MDSANLLSDITTRGDTLVVLSRSYLYYATAPYRQFHKVEIQPAVGDDGKVSLFRQVWLLHSGGLFGTVGKLIVDLIALILIALCVTGVWFWVRPTHTKVLNWHNKNWCVYHRIDALHGDNRVGFASSSDDPTDHE